MACGIRTGHGMHVTTFAWVRQGRNIVRRVAWAIQAKQKHLQAPPRMVVMRAEPCLAHGGLQRKLGHLAPQARQQPLDIQRTEVVELLEGGHKRCGGRRVHEVEAHEVIDAHRLERQHSGGQVGALNLWDSGR